MTASLYFNEIILTWYSVWIPIHLSPTASALSVYFYIIINLLLFKLSHLPLPASILVMPFASNTFSFLFSYPLRFVHPILKCFSSICLASNPPNPSWASFMKMQIHSRAGKNVNIRKLPCSTNQKRRTIKNRQQQPGDPNSVQLPPEIATHACINPLLAKNMWLKKLCCHLLLGTSPLPQEKGYLSLIPHTELCLKYDSCLLKIAFDIWGMV